MTTALHVIDPSPTREDPGTTNHAGDATSTSVVDTTAHTGGQATSTGADADTEALLTLDEANNNARMLTEIANAARMALRASTRRGEITAWSTVLDLPNDFTTARDELEVFAQHHAGELVAARKAITPVINELNTTQKAQHSWALPVPKDTPRGVWAGREHWIDTAVEACDIARTRDNKPLQCSHHTAKALITARADFFNTHGHGCTTAAATIVERAINRHGARITLETGLSRLRAINRVLTEAGLLIIHTTGRHLKSIERLAARVHHGKHQKAAGSVVDANIPDHLLPHPKKEDQPTAPGYATGLEQRLAKRDANTRKATSCCHHVATTLTWAKKKSSTYTCGYGLSSPLGNHRVAHTRAHARENHDHDHQKKNTGARRTFGAANRGGNHPNRTQPQPHTRISLRAWAIADDLSRPRTGKHLNHGPYSHLVGEKPHQMQLITFARLIDELTPTWAGTKDVLRGLAHAATSKTTGYIALGLNTRPANATAWMRTVLTRIDWVSFEDFPTWAVTATAYSLDWCGNHREWQRLG